MVNWLLCMHTLAKQIDDYRLYVIIYVLTGTGYMRLRLLNHKNSGKYFQPKPYQLEKIDFFQGP